MAFVGTSVVITSPAPSQVWCCVSHWQLFNTCLCYCVIVLERGIQMKVIQREQICLRTKMMTIFTNDDADLEDFLGCGGPISNNNRCLCAMCYDAPRDCFFLPCSHCISCNEYATIIG